MRKISYRSQLSDDSGKFLSCVGSPIVDEYGVKIHEKTGVVDFVKTGEQTNFQEMIEASYDSVEIHSLMKRFQLGDTEVFNRKSGFFGDVTEMPHNMAEMFQRVNDCKSHFEQLPTDIKEEFNNSYTEYFSLMNDNPRMFNEKISKFDLFVPDVPDIPDVPDVKGEFINESE